MVTKDGKNFIEALVNPNDTSLLGVDYGERYIGYAVGDTCLGIASPQGVWDVKKPDMPQDILQFNRSHKVRGVVCGWPLHMDGSESAVCEKVATFAENMSQQLSLPILLWDERLSSHQAGNIMVQAGTKKKNVRQNNHAVAASLILQGFLDRLKVMDDAAY